jgi:hypothetical protein
MKKIKGNSSMNENPNNFSLILRAAFNNSENNTEPLVLGPNGVYYSAYEDIEGLNNFNSVSDQNTKGDNCGKQLIYFVA